MTMPARDVPANPLCAAASSVLLGIAWAVTGCVGDVTGPRRGASDGAVAAPSQPPADGASAYRPPIAGLRRLTRREYDATLAALLGDTSAPARAFPEDVPDATGFDAAGAVGPLDAELLQSTAEDVVRRAMPMLPSLLGCSPAGDGERACVRAFDQRFGLMAWRRPVTAEEAADLLAMFDEVRAFPSSFEDSVAAVMVAMLQSPNFLYHRELGDERPRALDGVVTVTGYQMASRLSYLMTGTMPDASLFEAAAAGRLSTDEEIDAQARRLVDRVSATSSSGDTWAEFVRQWLAIDVDGVEKSPQAYPEFAALKPLLLEEHTTLVRRLVDGGAGIAALLSDPTVVVNRASAPVYGLPPPPAGSTDVAMTPGDGQRAGVLTTLPFLSVHATPAGSHPIKRGALLWRSVLCGGLPSPPDSVPPPTPVLPGQTTREHVAEHEKAECAVCHRIFDSFGFAFESYDGIGRYRTMEGTRAVDASGAATLPWGSTVTFRDGVDLTTKLSTMPDVHRCVAAQLARYATGVTADAGVDAQVADDILRRASGTRLKDLLVAVTRTRAFRLRTLAQGESP